MTCAIITRLVNGKTDVIMMLNGALGGLVAITAEPLTPTPLMAIIIGSIGGIIVIVGTEALTKFKIDDVVGAIPAHLFTGIWGTLIVPWTNSDTSYGVQLLGGHGFTHEHPVELWYRNLRAIGIVEAGAGV